MNTSMFRKERIIGFLRQAEAGMSIKEVGRKYGFGDAPQYKRCSTYREMEAIEAKRLRYLELDNGKLKRLLAEANMDFHAVQTAFGTKRHPHESNASQF